MSIEPLSATICPYCPVIWPVCLLSLVEEQRPNLLDSPHDIHLAYYHGLSRRTLGILNGTMDENVWVTALV